MEGEKTGTDSLYNEEMIRELKEPDMYNVVLFNDNFTTQEFVVEVLRIIFHKTEDQAKRTMLDVHRKGRGVAGTYSFDIARTKVHQVIASARKQEYPLKCTMEKT